MTTPDPITSLPNQRIAPAAVAAAGSNPPPVPLETLRARSLDGTELHVEIHGNPDGPTIVFSHGWTCSIRFWWPLIAELGADYRLVAYDQRGHGGSERARPDEYSVPVLAEDLSAVLDAAAGPDRVILVGHSMGGMTIMEAGRSEAVRNRTRAALLASTGAYDLAARARMARGKYFARFLAKRMLRDTTPLGPRSPLTTRLLAYGTLGPKPGRALAIENATIIHACNRRVRSGWGRVLEILDVREGAAAMTAPTAVLVGTADRLTPPWHADHIAGLLANLHSKTVLPKVGHMSPIERPALVAVLIRELDAVTRGGGGGTETASAPVSVSAEIVPDPPESVPATMSTPAPTLTSASTEPISE